MIEEAKFYGVPSLIGALVVPPVGSVVRYGTYQEIAEVEHPATADARFQQGAFGQHQEPDFEIIMWEGTVIDFDYMARTWTVEVTMESRNSKDVVPYTQCGLNGVPTILQLRYDQTQQGTVQQGTVQQGTVWNDFSLMDESRVDQFQQLPTSRFFDPMVTTKDDLFLVLVRYRTSHGLVIGNTKTISGP